jgi:hypothetical protein
MLADPGVSAPLGAGKRRGRSHMIETSSNNSYLDFQGKSRVFWTKCDCILQNCGQQACEKAWKSAICVDKNQPAANLHCPHSCWHRNRFTQFLCKISKIGCNKHDQNIRQQELNCLKKYWLLKVLAEQLESLWPKHSGQIDGSNDLSSIIHSHTASVPLPHLLYPGMTMCNGSYMLLSSPKNIYLRK